MSRNVAGSAKGSMAKLASGKMIAPAGQYATALISLFKLRIVGLLVFLAVAASLAAGSGAPRPAKVILLCAAGLLSCAGASAANNYLDRDIDRTMSRTRARPLPLGAIKPAFALGVATVFITGAVLLSLWLSLATAIYVFLGAFTYVVLYTWVLKRRSWLNIVVGGLAGSLAVLAGWAAVGPAFSPVAGLLALLLFLWTPAHFWAFAIVNKSDYEAARVPMLPVVFGVPVTATWIFAHTLALSLVAVAVAAAARTGFLFVSVALGLGTLFTVSAGLLLKAPSPGRAWRHYKLSGFYLLLLFGALAADRLIGGV